MPLTLGDLSHVITPPVSPVAGPMALNQGIEGAQQTIRMNAQVAEENANRQAQIAQDEAERASREAYQHAQQALEKARYDEIARANAAKEEQKHQTAMAQHIANAPKDPALLDQWIAGVQAEGGSVEPKPAPKLAPELAGLTRTGPMATPTAAVNDAIYGNKPGQPWNKNVSPEEQASLDQFLGGKANEARTAIAGSATEQPGVVTRADQELGDGTYVVKDRHGKVLGEVNPKARYEENRVQLRMAVGGMAMTARPEERHLWQMLEKSPQLTDSLLKAAGGNAQLAFADLLDKITNPQMKNMQSGLNASAEAIARSEHQGGRDEMTDLRIADERKDKHVEHISNRFKAPELQQGMSKIERARQALATGTGMGDVTAGLIEINTNVGGRVPVQMVNHVLKQVGLGDNLEAAANYIAKGGQLSQAQKQGIEKLLDAAEHTYTERLVAAGEAAKNQVMRDPYIKRVFPQRADQEEFGNQARDAITGDVGAVPEGNPNLGVHPVGGGGGSRTSLHGPPAAAATGGMPEGSVSPETQKLLDELGGAK